MSPTRPTLRVFDDASTLVTQLSSALAERAAAKAGRFFLSLAGGSTPKRLYQSWDGATLPWGRVELFFGDERAVPEDHPESNYRMVREALLSRVEVTAHRMRALEGDAEGYARVLGERVEAGPGGVPRLDVALLGMGTDGHTASLFPGTAALEERAKWVVMNEVPQLATRRMTLTYPVLDAAMAAWVMITGKDKRDILRRVLDGAPLPIARLASREVVYWLDRDAAP